MGSLKGFAGGKGEFLGSNEPIGCPFPATNRAICRFCMKELLNKLGLDPSLKALKLSKEFLVLANRSSIAKHKLSILCLDLACSTYNFV